MNREFAFAGFRCEVAGMVSRGFWTQARATLDKVKPELFLLAEWHGPELLKEAFDADYAGLSTKHWTRCSWTERRQQSCATFGTRKRATLPEGRWNRAFSDNHKEKRAIARFGERGALAASVLMFMRDGIPLLYNGQEVDDTAESGAPALFERVPIFWGNEVPRPRFRPFYQS